MQNGLLREYSCEELEFADGSKDYTSGFGDIELIIPTPDEHSRESKRGDWTTNTIRFHVLKSLHFDVILDEDIVEDFNIFQNGLESMLSAATDVVSSLGTIAHLRTVAESIINAKDKVKDKVKAFTGSFLPVKPLKSSKNCFNVCSTF